MEMVALLLVRAFALTFVACTGKPKPKALKAAPVRVRAPWSAAHRPRKSVLRR